MKLTAHHKTQDERMKRIPKSVSAPQWAWDEIDDIAEEFGASRSTVIGWALMEYIKRVNGGVFDQKLIDSLNVDVK